LCDGAVALRVVQVATLAACGNDPGSILDFGLAIGVVRRLLETKNRLGSGGVGVLIAVFSTSAEGAPWHSPKSIKTL
jgi:hypothetical protein